MWKETRTLTSFLDRDLSWSYQEILAEAILVLWLATKVSVELSRQFFPEWRETRIDPELAMDPKIGLQVEQCLSQLFLGLNSTSCFWERAASFWIKYDDDFCVNRSLPVPNPNATKNMVAYFAISTMLFNTAILYISVFSSLFVNRHWRLPFWSVPCLGINGGSSCAQSKKGKDGNDCDKAKSVWSKSGLFPFAVTVCLVALTVVAVVAVIGWLVLLVCPVVILATVAAHTLVAVNGDEVVLPCCVAFTSILTLHCTARIWGMWMRDCYSTSVWGLIQKIRGKETVLYVAVPTRAFTDRTGKGDDDDIAWLLKFGFGCWFICLTVWPFVGRQLPGVFTYLPWERLTISEDCLRISNSTEHLDRTDALLSYWVAAGDLFGNATGVSLPEVSPLSQTSGRVYLVWNVLLILASEWYLYLFFAVGAGLAIYGIPAVFLSCIRKFRRKGEKSSTIRKDDTERSTQNPLPDTRISHRNPEGALDVPRGFVAIFTNLLTCYVLLYLAPEFFLPERYQLPGILFLTTCFTIWLHRMGIPGFITTWRIHKGRRTNPGEGQRLLDTGKGIPTAKKDYQSISHFA